MPSPYVEILRQPGAWQFSAAGLIARLPLSMLSIGMVLLVESERDSYALAGAVSATTAVAEAIGQPLIARWVDRFGQQRVIGPVLAAHVVLLPMTVVAVASDIAAVWLFPLAALTGATFPPVGSLVRARWAALLGDGPLLRTAFSLESVADEVVFVVGPPLITLTAIAVGPAPALIGTLIFLLPGTLALLAQRATEPATSAPGDHAEGVLRSPGLLAVVAVMFLLGGVFGAVEIATIASADAAGAAGAAGIVLAGYALGSLLSGLAYGQLTIRAPLPQQFLVGVLALAATSLLLPLAAGSLVWLTVAAVVAGAAISPSLITGFGLAVVVVDESAVTQGLAWVTSGLILGFATTSAITGVVVDEWGPREAFAVAVASAFGAAVAALAGSRRLANATR